MILATLVLAFVVVTIGAITLGYAAGFVGVPSLEEVDSEVVPVDDAHTEVRTQVVVENPNPVSAKPADVTAEYTVTANDIEVTTVPGEQLAFEPGRSTETFTTTVPHDRIPAIWASHVTEGERTEVVVDGTVSSGLVDGGIAIEERRTVETDLLSSLESDEPRPIEVDVPVVGAQTLLVTASRAEWGAVDERRTELELGFDVYNPDPGPDARLTAVRYRLTANELVLGEGEIDREYVLESGEETTVDGTAAFETDRLIEWWISHLENDETSEFRLEFEAVAELPTGATVDVPLDDLTQEVTLETDLRGTDEVPLEAENDGIDRPARL